MTEAPKKIYAFRADDGGDGSSWSSKKGYYPDDVEYIRADIVEELVRGINAVLGAKEFDGMMFSDRLSLAKRARDSFIKP